MNAKVLARLSLLRSPISGLPLELDDGVLIASEAPNERFPFVGTSAILVAEIRPEHWQAPDSAIVSQNKPTFSPPPNFLADSLLVLHVGCGATGSEASNTLSIDILPLPNVDIVADVERLPFVDASVDFIFSGAVLEHVRDPLRAIDEMKRILKPGGILHVDTAFMQSYHGFPSHYFNLTPLAAEAHLGGAFEIIRSGVSPGSSELIAIHSLLARFASYLDPEAKSLFLARTIGDLIEELTHDYTFSNPLIAQASEYAHRAMSASFHVVARKPADYDPELERSAEIFRYYEARMAVLLREHEIDLYRRFATSLGADVTGLPLPITTAKALLADATPTQTTREAFVMATTQLSAIEDGLKATRDPFITAYLQALDKATATAVRSTDA